MTEEQKDILIAKMLDAQSSLSDEELGYILDDEELKDILGISAMISGAFVGNQNPDVHAEWERFRPRILRKSFRLKWFAGIAVAVIGALMVSAVFVNNLDTVSTSDSIAFALPEEIDSVNQIVGSVAPAQSVVPVETWVTAAAPISHVAKVTVHKARRAMHANSADIDIDEFLRIQQARIDNELALQNAGVIEDEYDTMRQILQIMTGEGNDADEDPDLYDDALGALTMQ